MTSLIQLPKTSEKTMPKDTHIVSIAVEMEQMDGKNAQLIKFDRRTSLNGTTLDSMIP